MTWIRRPDNDQEIRTSFLIAGMIGMAAIGYAVGYEYGSDCSAAITTQGGITVELRYEPKTRWFELYENGILTSKITATELGLDYADNPKDWRPTN